jgi:hypothetical protein
MYYIDKGGFNVRKESCYALYKGDKFIDLGTIKELSERLEMSTSTLWFYTSKAYKKRSEQKNSNNLRILIKIEENEYESNCD